MTCPRCGGSGQELRRLQLAKDNGDFSWIVCSLCKGTGQLKRDRRTDAK